MLHCNYTQLSKWLPSVQTFAAINGHKVFSFISLKKKRGSGNEVNRRHSDMMFLLPFILRMKEAGGRSQSQRSKH